jgi:hypothetical protein
MSKLMLCWFVKFLFVFEKLSKMLSCKNAIFGLKGKLNGNEVKMVVVTIWIDEKDEKYASKSLMIFFGMKWN